ncbi:nuclear transport factor 2 family protein [Pseudoxanthomonas sp. JBR18]|uniref:nuclear transport factor 2 family protein n=1 Tax=Pseudoxanthomonas sp. JBR18 TaxID=2969308 RepID=UPI0023066555|nr:nuclear transport factor 2 family protein [Pseudoxanthomonas sp. JBR18]WCE06274.1 nuclear transport factor 2 family protein [Pseudoxanthomonas sp. JBR18]
MTAKQPLQSTANRFIAATNAFDAPAVLALFAPDAVIDDPSTGHTFVGHPSIRDYVERYFVGYNTATRLLSLTQSGKNQAAVRVDFKGDFGHEIGLLVITLGAGGLITRIDADLE